MTEAGDQGATWAQDFAAGCLVALIGIAAIAIGQGYGVGTLHQMEPGFFPVALGVLLGGLGVALGITALKRRPATPEAGATLIATPDWRGWGFIVGGVVAFLLLGRNGGLIPAAFACVFISAMGDRTMTIPRALILATCMTVVGTVLFSFILRVQMPMLTWGHP